MQDTELGDTTLLEDDVLDGGQILMKNYMEIRRELLVEKKMKMEM